MNIPNPELRVEPPISEYTETIRKNVSITWYRTKLSSKEIALIHRKSDIKGGAQTIGYLGLLLAVGYGAWHFSMNGDWILASLFVFIYGMFAAFLINAVHELGHGTVFKTKSLNVFFCHLFAFLGWINHETFQTSHTRHHRYTLHPPDDLEVLLPIPLVFWHVVQYGIINPLHFFKASLADTIRIARGQFKGDWELTLYPEKDLKSRKVPIRWARFMLLGHAFIFAYSIYTHQYIIPILTCANQVFGSWLFFLCNNTQHVGLKDNVSDFRLCCRTFTLNPFLQFLYWHMNYHTEHHMYAAVPCYNLAHLHRLIRHDLPNTPNGLIAVWKEINGILKKQKENPSYQHEPLLPKALS